jgi:hypothetical protein
MKTQYLKFKINLKKISVVFHCISWNILLATFLERKKKKTIRDFKIKSIEIIYLCRFVF